MKEAVDNLNEMFNSELLDIDGLLEYKKKIEMEVQKAKEEMSSSGKATKEMEKVTRKVEEAKKEVESLTSEFKEFERLQQEHENRIGRLKGVANDYIDKISLLERTKFYLDTLREIKETSLAVSERPGKAVIEYASLCKKWEAIKDTEAANILEYLQETIKYWHSVLKERLTKEYEECLQKFKWPFLTANVPPVPSPDLLSRFQAITLSLLEIALPDSFPNPDSSLNPDSDSNSDSVMITLPVDILIRPLRKRFLFHFSGSRKTNQIEKPEWYFTRILTWIKDHQEFVEKHVQPVYDKMESPVDARVEFKAALVQSAVDKLKRDLPNIQYDDTLFSHTLDEALGFARELKDGFGYPDSEVNVFSVITQPAFLVKWISLEKKYSSERLDEFMRSERAFERSSNLEDDSEFTTECVDKFVNLLLAITERYKWLPQPGHRLQFLEFQMELLDNFRVRLLQLLRAEEELDSRTSIPGILNSISGIISVLEEWSISPHFLLLQFYQAQTEETRESGDVGVFENVIELLKSMQEELLNNTIEAIVYEVKAKSREYRRDRWHAMEDKDDRVTPSSVPIFFTLTKSLYDVKANLTPRLRTVLLHRLANSLDSFFYEDLAMLVRFAPSGAQRLEKDFKFGLLPLFGQYLPVPEAHFPLLADVCVLLNLTRGSAFLLKGVLEDDTDTDDVSYNQAITQVGVKTLNTTQILQILSRRIDLMEGNDSWVVD